MKILIFLAALSLSSVANAAVITRLAPIVVAEDIVKVETIPPRHIEYYSKGILRVIDRPAIKICYDKNSRKVACPDNFTTPLLVKNPTVPNIAQKPTPRQQPMNYQPPVQNQYEQQSD